MIRLKTVLCPTDFSNFSAHALPYGVEFARKFGATLILLHVMNLPDYVKGYYIPLDEHHVQRTMTETAENELASQKAALEKDGVKVETAVVSGSPSFEIVRFAREREVDLIVLSTHGRGHLVHMLIGSTAERVVRDAPCPVLTLRHPEHEFIHP